MASTVRPSLQGKSGRALVPLSPTENPLPCSGSPSALLWGGQAGSFPGTHPVGPTSSPQEVSDLLTSASPSSGPGGVSMAWAVCTRNQRLAWVLWTDGHPGAWPHRGPAQRPADPAGSEHGGGKVGGCAPWPLPGQEAPPHPIPAERLRNHTTTPSSVAWATRSVKWAQDQL